MTKEDLLPTEAEKLIREWFYVGQSIKLPDTGEMVTVVGFGKKYLQRGGSDHKRAGVYIDFNRVRLSNKCREKVWSTSSLYLDPWPKVANCEKMGNLLIRLGDLPNTSFWVGDVVSGLTRHQKVITSVYYGDDVTLEKDRPYLFNGERTCGEPERDLTLIDRGNIWKLEHGEPLSFPGETEEKRLLEEAAFYKSLGMSSKLAPSVDVEDNRFERHTFGEALRAIKNGTAHEMIHSNRHKDADPEHRFLLIRYNVPQNDFAERMRQYTLKYWTA